MLFRSTTCEALWMGVPVVTLAGERHSSRVGASLLHRIGRDEWTASDPAQFVSIVAKLCSDLPRLAGERAELRARVAASPLRDEPVFARGVEAAFRSIWRRWCAGELP